MSPGAAALIRAKREGHRLDGAQWRELARGIASGDWSEGQIGAFAMAVAWRGLDEAECRDFTFALRDSGQRLDWRDLPGPVLDKHSTGGVGDGVSLALAPLLAACGAYVPMISGRGLGHTGGTLDKLESLPGYDVHPTPERLRRVVAEVGCAIVGQSADLVPADRRLYAVRDVSATVDVPELIVASILSKKLAGGAQALVLDIKTGSGAQTPDEAAAQALAQRYPSLSVEEDALYVRDGKLRTAAGVTAGLDLALMLVEEDLGREIALRVAAQLVMFFKRPGGQLQFSRKGEAQPAGRSVLQQVQRWVAANPQLALTVEALAEHAGLSPRHFARLFHAEVGVTPAAWVESARVAAARALLEAGGDAPKQVAAKCGFANADTLRRAFFKHVGVTPAEYRKRYGHGGA